MSWSAGNTSPRKGLNFSAKNSPRRLPSRSPSELSPFSFSQDSLKLLATDIDRQNGKIPMYLPLRTSSVPSTPNLSRSFSQPRTPISEFLPPINQSTPLGTPPTRNYPLGGSLSCGAQAPILGGGSGCTPGRTVREYEDSFKELKKENLNLKMRIFFLEERMGRSLSKDELASTNIDLKVQLEGCKQEMSEKDDLLQEAINALDILEQKLQNSELRRQAEVEELQERLMSEQQPPRFELGPPRKSMNSPDVKMKMSPAGTRKMFLFQEEFANNKDDRLMLDILEEKDEVSDASGLDCLVQRNDANIRKMQSDLCNKEKEIEILSVSMRDKVEEIGRMQQLLKKHKDEATLLLTSLQTKDDIILNKDDLISRLEERVGDSALKHLSDEIEFKNQEIKEFQIELRKRDGKIRELETKICKTSELSPAKSLPRPERTDTQTQTETQEDEGLERTKKLEDEGLERTRKLEEQLRLQNQERKLLLKKIHMLRAVDSSAGADLAVRCQGPNTGADLAVQCDLGHQPSIVQERAYLGSVKRYRTSIAGLRKRLASSTDACDALREQLEAMLDTAERVSMNTDTTDELRRMIIVSRDLSRSIGNSLIRSLEEHLEDGTGSSSDDSTWNQELPRVEDSTWNLELPNIADINLESDTEHTGGSTVDGEGVLGDDDEGVDAAPEFCGNVIQHLHEQIQTRDRSLCTNQALISKLQENITDKEKIIKEQSSKIRAYRDELVCLDLGGRSCPNLERRGQERFHLRKHRRRLRPTTDRRTTPDTAVGVAKALSEDSDEYSEPEPGISLARIGLGNQTPKEKTCGCSQDVLYSDSETDQNSYSVLECCARACLSSSSRILQGLVGSILHQLDECEALDSGFDEEDVEDGPEDGELSLCISCTRSLPREFEENLQNVHSGLCHVQQRVQQRMHRLQRRKMTSMYTRENVLQMEAGESLRREVVDLKDKLNSNYVLVAQLSAENLRILGENTKLEKRLEELKREKAELEAEKVELRLGLEAEIAQLNSTLADKEIEVESMKRKADELDQATRELNILEQQVHQLKAEIERQEAFNMHDRLVGFEKSSPETSSSFDFLPPGGSLLGTSLNSSDTLRPRAFSTCTRNFSFSIGREKLTEVSSPDLGVDMESDPFSSLERGQKVDSLAFDKLIRENKNLRREKEVLGQKLVRSKAALQDTLSRLSRSNLHKQDQVASPATARRPPSRVYSERGNLSTVPDSPPMNTRRRLNATEEMFTPPADSWNTTRAVSEQNFKPRRNKSFNR